MLSNWFVAATVITSSTEPGVYMLFPPGPVFPAETIVVIPLLTRFTIATSTECTSASKPKLMLVMTM